METWARRQALGSGRVLGHAPGCPLDRVHLLARISGGVGPKPLDPGLRTPPYDSGLPRVWRIRKLCVGRSHGWRMSTTAACGIVRGLWVQDVFGLEGWSALLYEMPDFATGLVKPMTNRLG